MYRLPSMAYVVSKVGRSTVAHTELCSRLNRRRMRRWLEAGDEARVHRVPCLECMPAVGDQMDPQTWLECSRYTVLQARDPESLGRVLMQGRPGDTPLRAGQISGIVAEIIRQVRASDTAFGQWWTQFITSGSQPAGDHQGYSGQNRVVT